MRKIGMAGIALLGMFATVTGLAAPSGAAPASAKEPAGAAAQSGTVIPGRFIVTLRDGESGRSVAGEYRRRGASVDHVYAAALQGFAGAMSDAAVARARADQRVASVEPDRRVVLDAAATQDRAPWGIDRTDQLALPLDASYTYDRTGAGVTAYILDSGIRASHTDLAGRVATGFTAISDGRGTDDCNGHGTHVAGTVGGTAYGVAKEVTLVPVRVLDCNGSGSWSGVLAGIDYVTKDTARRPAVANMSLGGGAYSTGDSAVQNSIASGVTYAVSAGNGNTDACNQSPARVPEALTVAATTSSDARASYSNFGSCVDLFGPGSSVTSAYHTSDTATATMSGTSMSSPHVAGVAALHLQSDPAANAATVASAITSTAVQGVVTDVAGSPNLLLHSPLLAAEQPIVEQPPAEEDPPAEEPVVEEPAGISLSVHAYKVKGQQKADLSWTGTTATKVDVRRDGKVIATTANDGAFTDNINRKGGGTYAYEVCESGTTTCSAPVTASF